MGIVASLSCSQAQRENFQYFLIEMFALEIFIVFFFFFITSKKFPSLPSLLIFFKNHECMVSIIKCFHCNYCEIIVIFLLHYWQGKLHGFFRHQNNLATLVIMHYPPYVSLYSMGSYFRSFTSMFMKKMTNFPVL